MTAMEHSTSAQVPSDLPRDTTRITPRAALGRLPAYAAGKPASEVPGLVAYKLASNENPFGAGLGEHAEALDRDGVGPVGAVDRPGMTADRRNQRPGAAVQGER